MTIASYAIVQNGEVTNVILWDGNVQNWAVPEGASTVLIDGSQPIGIGYTTSDGKTFTAPQVS